MTEEIERLRLRVAKLEAAKWDVRHVDTMNDMAAMGMARDAAQAELSEVKKLLDAVFCRWANYEPFDEDSTEDNDLWARVHDVLANPS